MKSKYRKETLGFGYKKVESISNPYQVHVFEVINTKNNKIRNKLLKRYSCYNEDSREYRIHLLEKEGIKPLDYYMSEDFWCSKDSEKVMVK